MARPSRRSGQELEGNGLLPDRVWRGSGISFSLSSNLRSLYNLARDTLYNVHGIEYSILFIACYSLSPAFVRRWEWNVQSQLLLTRLNGLSLTSIHVCLASSFVFFYHRINLHMITTFSFAISLIIQSEAFCFLVMNTLPFFHQLDF